MKKTIFTIAFAVLASTAQSQDMISIRDANSIRCAGFYTALEGYAGATIIEERFAVNYPPIINFFVRSATFHIERHSDASDDAVKQMIDAEIAQASALYTAYAAQVGDFTDDWLWRTDADFCKALTEPGK
ncbi:MAG: hypothetical protein COB08_000590 [Rhodobacteraceae bacterium]|nr:hypothetical protein [Paracoccaceae bacterium]